MFFSQNVLNIGTICEQKNIPDFNGPEISVLESLFNKVADEVCFLMKSRVFFTFVIF